MKKRIEKTKQSKNLKRIKKRHSLNKRYLQFLEQELLNNINMHDFEEDPILQLAIMIDLEIHDVLGRGDHTDEEIIAAFSSKNPKYYELQKLFKKYREEHDKHRRGCLCITNKLVSLVLPPAI